MSKEDSRIVKQPTSHNYVIRIDDVIEGVNNYAEELSTLYEAQETDNVIIYINTPGGNLNTCITLCNAIDNCNGVVTTVLEGQADSAGGPLLLSGDNIAVMPNTGMLIHHASGGTWGKMNDNMKYLEFSNEQIARFFKKRYSGFLSEQEIDSVLKGEDIWLHDDEIITRLEKRAELFEQELLGELTTPIVEEPEPTPPPKRKRSPKAS